jgi:hypothetical protein
MIEQLFVYSGFQAALRLLPDSMPGGAASASPELSVVARNVGADIAQY